MVYKCFDKTNETDVGTSLPMHNKLAELLQKPIVRKLIMFGMLVLLTKGNCENLIKMFHIYCALLIIIVDILEL